MTDGEQARAPMPTLIEKRLVEALLRACEFVIANGKPDPWSDDEWDALADAEHFLDANFGRLTGRVSKMARMT